MGERDRAEMPIAICLVSGGLDSAVCLAEAVASYQVAVLHINYGQRTEARELAAFHALADHFGLEKRLVVDISYLKEIGGTSLIDDSLEVETGLPSDDQKVPSTYVPFRNANILSVGASWAEVLGATALFIGAVEEDGSGYPDCREVFYQQFERAIDAGTKPETNIQIKTPLIQLNKAAIVKRGEDLNVPWHLTWSCYTESDEACGVCESCRLRLRGFADAGQTDPIRYRPS
ncbi:MAG: 7-cyano-7-deazaguanine synthase [Candidatus Krumholzibacteriia bacterium]|jgi:7-cyano-7-deazaguanine synthase